MPRPQEVRAVVAAADRHRVVTGMQLVSRRRDGTDGLVPRLATQEPPADGLSQVIVDAPYAASPAYPANVGQGFIKPLAVEWARHSELVTNPRTGKLVEVVETSAPPDRAF